MNYLRAKRGGRDAVNRYALNLFTTHHYLYNNTSYDIILHILLVYYANYMCMYITYAHIIIILIYYYPNYIVRMEYYMLGITY